MSELQYHLISELHKYVNSVGIDTTTSSIYSIVAWVGKPYHSPRFIIHVDEEGWNITGPNNYYKINFATPIDEIVKIIKSYTWTSTH